MPVDLELIAHLNRVLQDPTASPEARAMAREAMNFLYEASTWLAGDTVTQSIDKQRRE